MSAPTIPHAPPRAVGGGRAAAVVVVNEAVKGLQIVWTHRATQVGSILTMIGFYLIVQYFIGGGRLIDALVAETTPGLFAYVVAYLASMRVVAGILEERNAGTLEQTHLSPLSPAALAVGRLAAAMIEAVLVATVVVAVVLAVRGIVYPPAWEALVPAALGLAGLAGFALLLGAASFTFPGIGAIVHVIHMLVLVLNGTVVPPELFPRRLELLAEGVPSTLSVSATRAVLLDGRSLAELWHSGTLGWLLVHTAVFVAVGFAAYRIQVRRALRDGRLGPA
ncbi:MAG: ABC transporter permease [Nitriliruptorales bacterium]